MNKFLTLALIVGALAISGCTRPDRFGGAGGPGGAGGDGIAGSALPGSPGDPTSPAYFAQTIGDRVFFAVDQSSLSADARQTLDAQAQWLLSNPNYLIVIEGHADEQGTREYNVALGARRANSAREYLISRGVPGNRLRTISYGKERPVATCGNDSCWSQNRRAVTVISITATS